MHENPNAAMFENMSKEELIEFLTDFVQTTSDPWERSDAVKRGLEWPRSLIALVSNDRTFADTMELPADWEKSVDYVLSTFSERAANIVEQYIRHNKTLTEIAKLNNLTSERVRQIFTKTIYQMRSKLRYSILLHGIADTIKRYMAETELIQQTAYLSGYQDGYQSGIRVCDTEQLKIDPCIETSILTPISRVDMSTRLRNALTHRGVRVLGEIAVIPPSELNQIQHIGARSILEVEKILSTYGLNELPPSVIESTLKRYNQI